LFQIWFHKRLGLFLRCLHGRLRRRAAGQHGLRAVLLRLAHTHRVVGANQPRAWASWSSATSARGCVAMKLFISSRVAIAGAVETPSVVVLMDSTDRSDGAGTR